MTLVHVANGNTDVQHNVVLWPLQDLSFHYKFMHYIGLQKKKHCKGLGMVKMKISTCQGLVLVSRFSW